MNLRIAHVIQSIAPETGGPPAVIMGLANQQVALGHKVSVVTAATPRTTQWWRAWRKQLVLHPSIDLISLNGGWRQNVLSARQNVGLLHEQHDVLHLHGVWDPLIWGCLSVRSVCRARTVVAPHGMLNAWSLRQKRFKKTMAWHIGIQRALLQADRLHALSESEEKELRAILPRSQISILPNGINADQVRSVAGRQSCLTPINGGARKYILFLARLHLMKGPDLLLAAFAAGLRTGKSMSDVDLVMAGPDYGMLQGLRRQAAELGIEDRVKFPGAVFGAEKIALLQNAMCLCQPSRHEGFSMTLLEAMANGVPVVTTPESNFTELGSEGCGLVVNGGAATLGAALGSLASDVQLRAKMSEAGKQMIARRYTWDKIAIESLRMYQA